MKRVFSPTLSAEIVSAVQSMLAQTRIVNVSALAHHIQRRNLSENVALEDIEYAVLAEAQRHGGPIEFAMDSDIPWADAEAHSRGDGSAGMPANVLGREEDGAGVPLLRN
jgi:hypothetical protein